MGNDWCPQAYSSRSLFLSYCQKHTISPFILFPPLYFHCFFPPYYQGCHFLDNDKIQQPMKQMQDKPGEEKTVSPNRYNADLYIIEYRQHKNKKNHQNTPPKNSNNLTEQPTPAFNGTDEGNKESKADLDHRKNIDRLMNLLKRNSNSNEKENSACFKIFKYIEKMYKRYWRLRERNFKVFAFNQVKMHVKGVLERNQIGYRQVQLKDSLEMRENEIQRGSKNFELNELIHIVNLHTEEKSQANLKNSLSRELVQKDKEVKQQRVIPKKLSNNVFILRKNNSKEDISTRQQLSNTHIKSDQFLPNSTRIARSISPNSVGKSPVKSIGVKDQQLEKPVQNQRQTKENQLHEQEINSMILNASQEVDDLENLQQLSKLKFPSFGLKKPGQQSKRANRLMDNSPRKIVFHYRNSKEKQASPALNEYHIPRVFANAVAPQQVAPKILNKTPVEISQNQPTRFQRISSLQILNPQSIPPRTEPPSDNSKPSVTTKDRAESLSSRRCSSMPKITFTYMNKEETFVNPQPITHNIAKNSPIFELNKLKTSDPRKTSQGEDPYLCKNIQIAVKPIIEPLSTHTPAYPTYRATPNPQIMNEVYPTGSNAQADNNYCLPRNNFVPAKPTSPRPERFKIPSSYQTLPSTSFHSNPRPVQLQRNDYYGQKSKLTTQQTLHSPSRMRVRSTDAYILLKPKQHPVQFVQVPQMADINRQRARSCNTKMQVISRRVPLIKV